MFTDAWFLSFIETHMILISLVFGLVIVFAAAFMFAVLDL